MIRVFGGASGGQYISSITVCVTPVQKMQIEQRANARNMSVSEYARKIIEKEIRGF